MYSLMIALSLVLGMGFAAFECFRKKVPWRYIVYLIMLTLPLVIYMAAAVSYISYKGEAVGLNASGGAAGLILGVLIMSLITPGYRREYAQSLVMALPLMYGLGKIGCAFAGCCAGLSYHGIFKVTGKEGGEVFPVQALEAVVFISLFLLTVIMDLKGKYDYRAAVIVYAGAKIVLDFLRDTHADKIITANQLMCAGIIALFCIGLRIIKRKDTAHRNVDRNEIL